MSHNSKPDGTVGDMPIPAGQFKATCLDILNEVKQRGVSYVITKRGQPYARLVPAGTEASTAFGFLAGTVIEDLGDSDWPTTTTDPLDGD